MKTKIKYAIAILIFLFVTLIPTIDSNISFFEKIGIKINITGMIETIIMIFKILLPLMCIGILWYIRYLLKKLNQKEKIIKLLQEEIFRTLSITKLELDTKQLPDIKRRVIDSLPYSERGFAEKILNE